MICDIFHRSHGSRNAGNGTIVQKTLYFSDDENDCLPAPDPKLVRARRRHPDRSRRRRSANADILESVGLPPTVSYHDMKTLQDGLSIDDILGRRRRSSYGGCFKEAAAIIGGNATQVARCASRSAATVARWSREMTPPAVNKRLRKKSPSQSSNLISSNMSTGFCQHYQEQYPEEDALPHTMVSSKAWKSDSEPQLKYNGQLMQPGQWLRPRRAFSDVAFDQGDI